jgi:beta-glucosidase
VIGPLADDQLNQIGCWAPDAQAKDCVTLLTSLKSSLSNTTITYAQGLKSARSTDTSLFAEASAAAKNAEKVVMVLGEDNGLSGESNCRAFINLPGAQEALIKEIAKAGKPIILVVYAGRPIELQSILSLVDSVVYAWHLGTMAGPALADLLLGVKDFSGRLPASFVKDQGQIPVYYNYLPVGQYWAMGYIDNDKNPLYNFGSGHSYANLSWTQASLSKTKISYTDVLEISTYVTNTSTTVATEQPILLFVRDLIGSYMRPVTELKKFQRVSLAPSETKKVVFSITAKDLEFWTKDNVQKAEPGMFAAGIGGSADTKLTEQFELVANSE